MNNELLKQRYGKINKVIPSSSYTKGYKQLVKEHRKDVIDKLRDILRDLRDFKVDTQYKNHPLDNKRYELHITGDVLLTYKYDTGILYCDLILLDLTNHKNLNK